MLAYNSLVCFFKFILLPTILLIHIGQTQNSYFRLGFIQCVAILGPIHVHCWTGTGVEGPEELPGKEIINSVDDLLLAEEWSKLWLRHFEKKDYFLIAYLKNTNISSVSKVPTLLTLGFMRIVRMPRKKKKGKKKVPRENSEIAI